METTMKATVLAKHLKARISELKKIREGELAKYKEDFAAWKQKAAQWARTELHARLLKATFEDVKNERYNSHGIREYFLAGSPKPPVYPDDAPLRKVQAVLRQLAISGQQTMKLSTKEVEELFGTKDPNVED